MPTNIADKIYLGDILLCAGAGAGECGACVGAEATFLTLDNSNIDFSFSTFDTTSSFADNNINFEISRVGDFISFDRNDIDYNIKTDINTTFGYNDVSFDINTYDASSPPPPSPPITDGLVLYFDAANRDSYPGTGTIWYDLSGNNYHLTLNSASIWVNNGSLSHMNFENGIAKYLPSGVLTDIPQTNTSGCTICIFSTIKTPDSDWKTLVRGASHDHQVIIRDTDGISLGMYDNDTGQFIDSGFDVTSIPDRTTQLNYMVWKLNTSSPYYEFFYNNNLTSSQATLTSANATHNRGFASIGAYHGDSNNPTTFAQEWGRIGIFLFYNRHLTSSEMSMNYNALKERFNLL